MKNWISDGNNITMIAPAATVSGVAQQLSSGVVAVPASTAASGTAVSFSPKGVFSGQLKTTAEAWTVGQKLYWVTATSRFTTTAGTNGAAIGFATVAALAADTTGTVCLIGALT
jgi:predicted RecA/RadA family phage recombinase